MKHLIYILSFVLATTAIAQNSDNLSLEKEKLKLALSYSDEEVASSAMYNIIAIEGPQSTYKDSLAYLYFNNAKYVSCFLVTDDILKRKPNDVALLEMNAVSLESMGAISKAAEVYANLLTKTNNNYHAYKLSKLMLQLKKQNNLRIRVKLKLLFR